MTPVEAPRIELPMVDCFSGAGGLSLGLHRAGFKAVFAFDHDSDACATYSRNLGIRADRLNAAEVTPELICSQTGRHPGEFALVCGGPPCQGFSVQRRGSKVDSRNDHVVEFAKLAVALRPAVILLENVPGLLGIRGRPFLSAVLKVLRTDYLVDFGVLNAVDFSVPQSRSRAFIVAWLPERCPSGVHLPRQPGASQRTVRDAIGDLPLPGDDQASAPLPNHIRVRVSALNSRRISFVPEGGGRLDIPLELQLPCHRNSNGHRHLDVYGRMRWDSPAPTITAMFDNFTRGRFAHPTQDRSITGREGARLQTFPDDFVFLGDKKSVARQIGNAVPPALAMAVGMNIANAISPAVVPQIHRSQPQMSPTVLAAVGGLVQQ